VRARVLLRPYSTEYITEKNLIPDRALRVCMCARAYACMRARERICVCVCTCGKPRSDVGWWLIAHFGRPVSHNFKKFYERSALCFQALRAKGVRFSCPLFRSDNCLYTWRGCGTSLGADGKVPARFPKKAPRLSKSPLGEIKIP